MSCFLEVNINVLWIWLCVRLKHLPNVVRPHLMNTGCSIKPSADNVSRLKNVLVLQAKGYHQQSCVVSYCKQQIYFPVFWSIVRPLFLSIAWSFTLTKSCVVYYFKYTDQLHYKYLTFVPLTASIYVWPSRKIFIIVHVCVCVWSVPAIWHAYSSPLQGHC